MNDMQPANSGDAEQLHHLVHELAEALTATGGFLHAGQRLANQEPLRKAICKAIEQTDRAGEAVVKLRAIAERLRV